MTWPGAAASSAAVSRSGRLGGAGVADGAGQVGADQPVADRRASWPARRWRGRAVPAMATWSTWSAASPAVFSASSHAACAERARSGSRRSAPPTPSSGRRPGVRQRSRNSSVAQPPPRSSASSGPSPSSPTSERGGAVAAGGLVGAAGQAGAEVGARPRGGRRRPLSAARSAPTAERTDADGVEGADVGGRAAGRRGPRWRWSCRRRPAPTVENHERVRGRRPARGRSARAGRLDAHRGGVLVVAGDGAGALAAAAAGHRGDRAAVEPPVGQVRGGADDPACAHAAKGTRESDGSSHSRVRSAHAPRRRRQRRRRRRRQAARRRARARPRADAGAPLRHPAARPARAPTSSRSRTRRAATSAAARCRR